jgi:hypothetical protein
MARVLAGPSGYAGRGCGPGSGPGPGRAGPGAPLYFRPVAHARGP